MTNRPPDSPPVIPPNVEIRRLPPEQRIQILQQLVTSSASVKEIVGFAIAAFPPAPIGSVPKVVCEKYGLDFPRGKGDWRIDSRSISLTEGQELLLNDVIFNSIHGKCHAGIVTLMDQKGHAVSSVDLQQESDSEDAAKWRSIAAEFPEAVRADRELIEQQRCRPWTPEDSKKVLRKFGGELDE